MPAVSISLAEAKARLSELAERAAAGEEIVITKRGKSVARLARARKPRKAIDLAALQHLTASMPRQKENAGTFMRKLREGERY